MSNAYVSDFRVPSTTESAALLNEDWLAVILGLFIFVLGLAALVHVDLIGWVVSTSVKNHRYVDGDDKPIFPFGFGLSYTTFRFDGLRVAAPVLGKGDVAATVNVTNTGAVAGDEVAQLYVREDVSSVETAERSLKGFSRIHLEPSETKTVTFQVPQSELAIWNAERKWVVESGAYTVWVGDSSEASLTAKFTLEPK